MMAEAGLAALWLAAALATVQLIWAMLGLRGGEEGAALIASVRPAAIVQGALAAVAMIMLVGVFLASDVSVRMVVENTHSAMPWIDKLAAAWGTGEGSMLLWVALLGAAGVLVAVFERRLGDAALVGALAAQAAVALGSYAFLLFSNPFARIDPGSAGAGRLTPLLPVPALHQPLLYAGYVGLAVAFSLAIGTLVTGRIGPALVRAMRPWVLGAWIFLTLGITAGSYLAGRSLDPVDGMVENASLLAWLAATGLLHAVAISRLRRRRITAQAVLERMIWPTAATGLAFAALVVFGGGVGWLPLTGLSLAIGAGVASVLPLIGRRWHRKPLITGGMVVAHLGIAVSLAGVACEAAFTRETRVAVRAGERARVGPFTVAFDGIAPVIGDGWSALQAQLTATAGDRTLRLFPQSRFADPPTTTSQSAIAASWPGQLHAALRQSDAAGRWQLRLRWRPFVTLIWYGGALIALGGLLSLIGHVRQARRIG